MKSMTSLFLSQSYMDAWDNYIRSLTKPQYACWDYVILTASNKEQAYGYQKQIENRYQEGYLPKKTQFIVLPDPEGKRVGSGGATLNALHYIGEPHDKRILIIHSGGDSKRIPQYSLLGKIFSPVPRVLPDGRSSTLFDEILISMSGVPGRIPSGMFIVSGDVLLLWNPLQMDIPEHGAVAISFKEPVRVGTNHGVYRIGEDGYVAEFLHKQSPEMLRKRGAVNERDLVDIDTGAVFFSEEILKVLCELIKDHYGDYVNDQVRLSLYGDFLYPMASESTLEAYYQEAPEGILNERLIEARKVIWQIFRPFRMKLLRLSPAQFLHFGTSREILSLLYEEMQQYQYLGWKQQINSCTYNAQVAIYNSIIGEHVVCGEGSYIEYSHIHGHSVIGKNVILSNVEVQDAVIPDDVVLHGLRLKDGRYVVRMFGTGENPKNAVFLGFSLLTSLWETALYPVKDTMQEAVQAVLNLYELAHGRGDGAKDWYERIHGEEDSVAWDFAEKKSLKSSWDEADIDALFTWQQHLRDWIQMEQIWQQMHRGISVYEVDVALQTMSEEQKCWIDRMLKGMTDEERMRMYYYLGRILDGPEGEKYIEKCFETVQNRVMPPLESAFNEPFRIQKDSYTVQLPLRVNWGGGWTDTPPYCNDRGGTVLNAAILVNGKMPVTVTLRRLKEKKVIFNCRDMDCHQEYTSISELQKYGDPYDPFALSKAALLVCGIVPLAGGSLEEVLEKLGGGFFMSTEVTGIPKGSGLGTSSILAAACVKCIMKFFGMAYSEDDIIHKVLWMEQLMSTGGGWQDQVGGLLPGIKLITSTPGEEQRLLVEPISILEETAWELNQRYALIYTGQRRLARNQLREVMGRYIGQDHATVEVLDAIKRIAALMSYELQYGSIDGFAKLLSRHWELSRKLDAGCTNTCIDQILFSIEDLIDGCMICGAGGGGFLQVIMKKHVTKEKLHERLQEVFQDSGIALWDCSVL